ncbi:hypothetical protein CB1_000602005 [Camelus ferus]|nr:hypothetical protein CB1_000602005 [Camelus ferus]
MYGQVGVGNCRQFCFVAVLAVKGQVAEKDLGMPRTRPRKPSSWTTLNPEAADPSHGQEASRGSQRPDAASALDATAPALSVLRVVLGSPAAQGGSALGRAERRRKECSACARRGPLGTSGPAQCCSLARRVGRCWLRGPEGAGCGAGFPQLALGFSLFSRGESSGLQNRTLTMDLVGFGYAALVTFGSILGYKRRGGVPSLIGGLFVGFLAGYGAYRVSNDKRDVKVSLCE